MANAKTEVVITVFMPLMRQLIAPTTELHDYCFRTGIRASADMPDEIRDAIDQLSNQKLSWVPQLELNSLADAKGWVWTQQRMPWQQGHALRNHIASSIVRPMEATLTCAQLAGVGENTHWHFGAFSGTGRIYVSSGLLKADGPFSVALTYAAPSIERRTAAWNEARLAIADDLYHHLMAYKGENIARLELAFHSYLTLITLNNHKGHSVERNLRLQIAVSALETFYIAPSDHKDGDLKHLWRPGAQERVAQLCPNALNDHPDIWEELPPVRNDIAHRSGISSDSKMNPSIIRVCVAVEDMLRETLRWEIRHMDLIAEDFEADRWPTV